MTRSLGEALAAHDAGDTTVRVVNGFFSVLPFAPTWRYAGTLEATAAQLSPDLAARVAARAELLARAPGPQGALAAFDFLDKGDAGIALFSGLRGAVKAVRGEGAAAALETDPQQAADAGLKAVGIAYATWKLFDGPVDDRARALLASATGRALLTWYVATDIVLPFADNFATGGTELVTELIDRQAAANLERLTAVAGPEVQEAAGMLARMADTLKSLAGQAATFALPLSNYAKESLPGILGMADRVGSVAATGVDALSAYRCLGASLVAEVLVSRALVEVQAEVEAERAAAEAARKKAEAEAEAARQRAEDERLRREAAEAAERARAVAEAERAREEAERARIEAERQRAATEAARLAAEEAARARSRQREDYTLDTPEEAASLRNSPIKVTRSADAELAASPPAAPARAGCFGCGAALLCVVLAGTASLIALA